MMDSIKASESMCRRRSYCQHTHTHTHLPNSRLHSSCSLGTVNSSSSFHFPPAVGRPSPTNSKARRGRKTKKKDNEKRENASATLSTNYSLPERVLSIIAPSVAPLRLCAHHRQQQQQQQQDRLVQEFCLLACLPACFCFSLAAITFAFPHLVDRLVYGVVDDVAGPEVEDDVALAGQLLTGTNSAEASKQVRYMACPHHQIASSMEANIII